MSTHKKQNFDDLLVAAGLASQDGECGYPLHKARVVHDHELDRMRRSREPADALGDDWPGHVSPCVDEPTSAEEILCRARQHMRDRAKTYDKPGGERSIGAAVEAFKAVTGDGEMNSEERGWLFMELLKMVRSQQGEYRADNYEDGTAYGALRGEAAAKERG